MAGVDWLTVDGGGMGDGEIAIAARCEVLAAGKYTGQVLMSAQGGQFRVVDALLDVPYRLYLPMVSKNK